MTLPSLWDPYWDFLVLDVDQIFLMRKLCFSFTTEPIGTAFLCLCETRVGTD